MPGKGWNCLLRLYASLEHDGFELNRRKHLLHLAPLAGRGRNSLCEFRVRGPIRESDLVERPLTPNLSERASLVSTPQAGRGRSGPPPQPKLIVLLAALFAFRHKAVFRGSGQRLAFRAHRFGGARIGHAFFHEGRLCRTRERLAVLADGLALTSLLREGRATGKCSDHRSQYYASDHLFTPSML